MKDFFEEISRIEVQMEDFSEEISRIEVPIVFFPKIQNFDENSKFLKLPYLQFPPIKIQNLEKNQKINEIPSLLSPPRGASCITLKPHPCSRSISVVPAPAVHSGWAVKFRSRARHE